MERLPVTAVACPAIVIVLAILATATLYDLTGKKPYAADNREQRNQITVVPSTENETFPDRLAGMRVILLGTGTPVPEDTNSLIE